MAARSAQQSTALTPRNSPSLATHCVQQITTGTPRSRRVSSAQQSLPVTPHVGCNSPLSQRSVPVTPHSHIRTLLTAINSRGSYRPHKRIPRQTILYQKKQKLNNDIAKESDENSHHLETEMVVLKRLMNTWTMTMDIPAM